MLEDLYKRETYGPELAHKIEAMGSIAVSIANRWALGWSDRVQGLLDANVYLSNLEAQMNLELDVLADAGHLQHLAQHEILEMHGVQPSPPTLMVIAKDGVSCVEGDAVAPLPAFVTKTSLAELFDVKPGDTLTDILSRARKPPA